MLLDGIESLNDLEQKISLPAGLSSILKTPALIFTLR
jgi:hypothetical protein